MKTPGEIKKGARHCKGDYSSYHCGECPYRPEGAMCKSVLHTDLLQLVQRLEEAISSLGHLNETMYNEAKNGIQDLEKRLAQTERERDAAVADLNELGAGCAYCAHFKEPCMSCCCGDNWQWRGVCPENTKEAAST